MKYTKKMILVSPEDLQRHDNQQLEGVGRQVSEFEQELKRLSSNTSKSPAEALQLYHQLFTRYLHLDQEKNEPKPVVIKQDSSIEEKPVTLQDDDETFEIKRTKDDPWSIEYLIQTLPKGKQQQAALFASYLKSSGMVKIDTNGEVIINGSRIEKSNIIDLINDFTRDRPKLPPAVGVAEVAEFLKKTNVPREYIGNPNRWRIINKFPSINKKQTNFNTKILKDTDSPFNIPDNFRTPTGSTQQLKSTTPKNTRVKLTYTPWK